MRFSSVAAMRFFQCFNAAMQFVNLGQTGQCADGPQQCCALSRRKLTSGYRSQYSASLVCQATCGQVKRLRGF